MPKNILHTIEKNMSSFSKGQKLIARFILEDYDKAAFMTASKLGKTVQVSESTVVRFATQLGYEGYPSMQRALQENEALLEVRHCNDQGVALFYNNKVVKFADGKLFIESTKDGEVKELPADVIVLSVGVKPNDALWQELLASGHPSVWKAGDAIATGKINKAVLHGSKFGYSLN